MEHNEIITGLKKLPGDSPEENDKILKKEDEKMDMPEKVLLKHMISNRQQK